MTCPHDDWAHPIHRSEPPMSDDDVGEVAHWIAAPMKNVGTVEQFHEIVDRAERALELMQSSEPPKPEVAQKEDRMTVAEAIVEKILALPREQQIAIALFVEWLHDMAQVAMPAVAPPCPPMADHVSGRRAGNPAPKPREDTP